MNRARASFVTGCILFLAASPALADRPASGPGSAPAKAPAASPSAAATSSSSADAPLAEALFQEALKLAKAGKLAEACPKFAASQKAAPSYGAAFNLGACHEELGRTASAWAAFTEAEPLARDAAERAEAKQRVRTLEARLIRRRIAAPSPPDGLTLSWDGTPLDRAAWDTAVPVDPGSHRLDASAPGKRPWSRTVDAADEGKTLTIDVPPLETDPGKPSSTWPVQRTIGIALGAAGVAGLVVGGVLGALASSKWDEAKPLCYPDHTCAPPGASLGNEARSLATGSTAAFIAGGALVAGGVIVFLTAKTASPDKASASARVTPWLSPTGAGAAAAVSF